MKYYAIKDDTHKLIVDSWEEAQIIIKECVKPKYKSFKSIEECNAFLNDYDYSISDSITDCKCYIDGSYDVNTSAYSFGGILIYNNEEYKFYKKYDKDQYSEYRNVAGEIKGAGYIINYCIKRNINTLHIFYDYLGIEKWWTGEWKANSSIAIEYVKFRNNVKDKINVIFHKVKSHTNDHYNDLADKLAKEALGIK